MRHARLNSTFGFCWRTLLSVIYLWILNCLVYANPTYRLRDQRAKLASNYIDSKAISLSTENCNQRLPNTNQEINQKCGVRPIQVQYDISQDQLNYPQPIPVVGGLPSNQRWPWQALLIDKLNNRPICGGVLVGNQQVLTAAHCFENHDRKNVKIILGEHDRSVHESTEQVYSIECLFIHKEYLNSTPYHNDIAMIKLQTGKEPAVTLSETVVPVCLPTKGEFKDNDSMCFITGWGFTSFENLFITDTFPDVLQEATIPLIDLETCQLAYGIHVTRRMQCAGYLYGKHRADTCKGDSGGPLVCQDKSGNFKLWGITSWGNNHFCLIEPSGPVPGVYTRVDKYLKWIEGKQTTNRCN